MEGIFAEMLLSANLLRLGSSIQLHAGSRGAASAGGEGGGQSLPPMKENISAKKYFEKFKIRLKIV